MGLFKRMLNRGPLALTSAQTPTTARSDIEARKFDSTRISEVIRMRSSRRATFLRDPPI